MHCTTLGQSIHWIAGVPRSYTYTYFPLCTHTRYLPSSNVLIPFYNVLSSSHKYCYYNHNTSIHRGILIWTMLHQGHSFGLYLNSLLKNPAWFKFTNTRLFDVCSYKLAKYFGLAIFPSPRRPNTHTNKSNNCLKRFCCQIYILQIYYNTYVSFNNNIPTTFYIFWQLNSNVFKCIRFETSMH